MWIRKKTDSVMIASSADALEACDIIFEAISEDLEAKRALFDVLENVVDNEAILVTTTSSIRLSLMAMKMRRPDRFAAVHFFYPVKLKNIAEIVFPRETSAETRERIVSFLAAVERRYLELPEEEAFLLNRVLLDYQAAAYRIHGERNIPFYILDDIVKSAIHPSGVFEFYDAVGIDVAHAALCSYAEHSPDPGYCAPLITALSALMSDGKKGKKNGAGFYNYSPVNGMPSCRNDDVGRDDLGLLLLAIFINSSLRAMEKVICPDSELDSAIRESMGVDRGPLDLAETQGRARLSDLLNAEYLRTGSSAIRPSVKW
jgi:3-hydroxyacyl-CoA dehydrogenase